MPQAPINPILNEKWLMRAAWWVAHRNQLGKIAAGIILVLSAAGLGYSIYGWADYWIFSRQQENQMFLDLSKDLVNTSVRAVPTPIAIPTVVVLPQSGRDGHYDVLAKIVNANPKWIADVTVMLSTSDQSQGTKQTITMLNNDEQFIIGAGLASSPGASASAVVTNVAWRRLNRPDELNARKPTFTVTDPHFTSAPELKISGNLNVGQVTFAVQNNSIYHFWSVDFTVVLMQGDQAMAASRTTLDYFKSDEKRQVSLNFYSDGMAVTNVLVVPYVNVADDSVFMNVPGKPIQFQ